MPGRPIRTLPTSPKRKRCATKGARIIGLFLLLALSLSLVTAGAAFGTTPSGGKISWARLAQKKLTKFEVGSVLLHYEFSKESSHFAYRLQIRQGKKWKAVKSVEKHGHFKGMKSMSVKKLFARKPVKLGSYRVKLSADRGSRTLSFEVIQTMKMTQISAGSSHTCALRSGGTVWCWGSNDNGELGNDQYSDTMIGNIPTPVKVGISTATQIAAGGFHTCALLSDGTVECWGGNSRGQLGDGTTNASPTPVEVMGIHTATQVAAGDSHSCALLSDGKVECWGNNEFGQLGNGTTDSSPIPVGVTGISNATQVSAGYHFTCALLSDGKVECWGDNEFGQLGNGTIESSSTPIEAPGISTATEIAVGSAHTCALLSDGKVECWGHNLNGELGNGPTDLNKHPNPVVVMGISTATQVEAGGYHTCARLSGGKVECWGSNYDGQLGNGLADRNSHPTPIEVKGISSATQFTAGDLHSCALLSDGRVKCWGQNNSGQLGDGTHQSRKTPVEVAGM